LIASELQRRLQFKTDRATVRRYALKRNLAPTMPPQKPKPKRRGQTQKVGQLWQYDASPHRWFAGQDWQPVLLPVLDDHSRVILGARLYERESLLAHWDFLSRVFQAAGLPLCL
jgi:transposase InsO family protein